MLKNVKESSGQEEKHKASIDASREDDAGVILEKRVTSSLLTEQDLKAGVTWKGISMVSH